MIKIYSKRKLSPKLEQLIVNTLKQKYSSKDLTNIKYVNDKTIIGGILIDIDSSVLDLTINKRLERVLEVLD